MKFTMKHLFFGLAILAATAFVSCKGTDDYNTYVESLKAQPAAIDTISSPASYAAYLQTLADMAQEFADKDVKLDRTQQDELETLSMQIQHALEAKYQQLAQTPATLPDSLFVEADNTAVEAPAEIIRQ